MFASPLSVESVFQNFVAVRMNSFDESIRWMLRIAARTGCWSAFEVLGGVGSSVMPMTSIERFVVATMHAGYVMVVGFAPPIMSVTPPPSLTFWATKVTGEFKFTALISFKENLPPNAGATTFVV